jgi:hypothetical protein
LDSPGTCRRSGDKPVGAHCEKDWRCESGYCHHEGKCIRSCLAEEDCPTTGRACDPFSDDKLLLGCYPKPDDPYSDCNVSCPEDQLCTDDECRPHACLRTAQCPEGDCVMSPKGLRNESLGQCKGEERLCNGWEFRIDEDDPFCRLAIDCGSRYKPDDFSCPEGYECVQGEPDRGRNLYTSWCSSRVTEGEWPPE